MTQPNSFNWKNYNINKKINLYQQRKKKLLKISDLACGKRRKKIDLYINEH